MHSAKQDGARSKAARPADPGSVGKHDSTDFEKAWYSRFVQFATLREDDAGIAGWSPTGLETRFRFFRGLWRQPSPGGVYLDVGCGAGTYSRWLAEQGMNVVGADYSHVALSKAKRRESKNVVYCVADANKLPIRGEGVDGALCFGVLQAVSGSRRILEELARVIRPGGEVWIDALNGAHPAARWDKLKRRLRGRPMHLRYESARSLQQTMREAGFDHVSCHWLMILPRRLYWAHPIAESFIVNFMLRNVPGLGALTSHSVLLRGVRRHSG